MTGRGVAYVLISGQTPDDWRDAMYYRYWMHKDAIHNAWAHYGIREHHKLICYYADMLGNEEPGQAARRSDHFSLPNGSCLICVRTSGAPGVYDDPDYEGIVSHLKQQQQ